MHHLSLRHHVLTPAALSPSLMPDPGWTERPGQHREVGSDTPKGARMTECTRGAEPARQPDSLPSFRLLRALLSNSLTHTGPLCSSSRAWSPTNIASFHPASAHLASRIKPSPMQQTKRLPRRMCPDLEDLPPRAPVALRPESLLRTRKGTGSRVRSLREPQPMPRGRVRSASTTDR